MPLPLRSIQLRFRVIFWLDVVLLSCVVIGFLQVAHFEFGVSKSTQSLIPPAVKVVRNATVLLKTASLQKDSLKPMNKKKKPRRKSRFDSHDIEEYLKRRFNTTNSSTIGDLHSTDEDIMDLLDWEMESLRGIVDPSSTMEDAIRTCRPPRHMDQQCCIGTYSMGGDIDWKIRAPGCANKTVQDYYYVRDKAKEFLEASASEVKNVPCDVCRIIHLQQKFNLTIALFGDSVSNQVMQGLTCELQRRNYLVHVARNFSEDRDCKRCIKWVTTATVTTPRQPTASPATIKFMFQYRYPFIYPHEEDYLASAGDILIVNFGLHWNFEARTYDFHRSHYRKSYGQFLMQLRRKGNFTLLMHRETTAQHFDSLAGDFSLRSANTTNRCVPIKYDANVSAWRERMVQQAAKKALNKYVVIQSPMPPVSKNWKRPELLVIPYYNFTAFHYKMHPSSECSHYCSSPFIYMPLWRSIRLAMDRQYGKQKLKLH